MLVDSRRLGGVERIAEHLTSQPLAFQTPSQVHADLVS